MKVCIYTHLFFLFVCLSSCNVKNICNQYKEKLSSITYEDALSLNKKIIPCLIDNIDIQKTSFIGFTNPINSNIKKWYINQEGIRYAYYIEYILLKDSVEIVEKTWNDDDIFHWDILSKPYRVYTNGIIIKLGQNKKQILEPLTHEDMILIKKMYLNWWGENKNKSIEEIRKEFRNGNIIVQYPYVWI